MYQKQEVRQKSPAELAPRLSLKNYWELGFEGIERINNLTQ
jgi:hypothetical protein